MRTLLHASRTRKRSIAAATLGALALVGSLLVATPAQAINDTGTGGVFVPASGRVLDTKAGTGGFTTPMEAGKYRTIKIAGVAGIPDDGTVGAVSLNATVSGNPSAGTLFGRPDADTSRTTMLIYNANTGEYVSNTAIVAVSAAGTIQVSTETASRLILDVQGYYTANTDGTTAGGFVPVAGKRIVDTRSGLGAPKALLAPGKSVDIQVTGANGVPASASGAVVNLLPINSTASDGYLTPYATGTTRPDNALHYAPSVNTSIQAQVQLSSSGKMTIYNGSSTINLVIDLQGYFTAGGTTGATFTPGVGRVFDSRATGNTILAKNETRAISVAGQAGVPVMGSGITAVVLTLSVVHGGSDGRASVWANGTTQPDTTSINFQTDEIRTNTVTVALGANGKINLNNVAEATNYVIDVQGWYSTPNVPIMSCPAPYAADATVATIPANDVKCTAKVAAAASSDQVLAVSIDGGAAVNTAAASTAATMAAATVPATAGAHTIDAALLAGDGTVLNTSTYSFFLGGAWDNAVLDPSTASGAEVYDEGYLQVSPHGEAFPSDVQQRLTISSSADPDAAPLYQSGWDTDASPIPAGLLVDGQTYFWHSDVTGTTNATGATITRTSPMYSFIASPDKVDSACASALYGLAQEQSAVPTAQEYIDNCTVTSDSESPTYLSSDESSTQSTVKTQMKAAGTVRTKTLWSGAPGGSYYIEHRAKFFYDGANAWSTTKMRGKVGWHQCGKNGSWVVWPASTKVTACGDYRTKGNDYSYMSWSFNIGYKGKGITTNHTIHIHVRPSGEALYGNGITG
ncbi:hypothetical protein KK101_11365 [Curtobacterium flaccumfaciens pv. oortii]|uniref:hypothetical protein n=1 Tax=Curtobacterium flaccumfaciens TaxID=2035 RepID=UPI001BDDE155|nr:hypothetical protein [Curtobacterium flaccumfaciens]MBT1623285.1 hypothetical protein [Curtobacterium flaccumfaciens pv. oortii]